jgi:hypothetical protein
MNVINRIDTFIDKYDTAREFVGGALIGGIAIGGAVEVLNFAAEQTSGAGWDQTYIAGIAVGSAVVNGIRNAWLY